MFTYQEEELYKIFHEIDALAQGHWQEVANHRDVRPLDLDYEKYITINEMKIIRVFTVREDGRLIGYASFFIAPHLHYKRWIHASSDVYYLVPDYRGKDGIGKEFFTKIEEWLKSLDVNVIDIQDKTHHTHEKFFLGLGYKVVEQVYEKVL